MRTAARTHDFSAIRLIVSDLDGTLLDQNNKISDENLTVVRDLQDAGIIFTFATGRLDCQAKIYIEQLGLDTPIISCNGALIRSGLTHEILHLEYFEAASAEKMVRFADSLGVDYMIYDTDEVYYPAQSERISVYKNYNKLAKRFNSKDCEITEIEIERDIAKVSQHVCKIYLYSEDDNTIAACRDFAIDELGLLAVSSMPNNMDIAPPQQTKGNALEWLAKYYGLRREEILVFGDNDNDVSMLTAAGIGFVMRNGSEMAKDVADFIAPSNNASGVARAIRQFVLP